MAERNGVWKWIERRSAKAFLIGGLLMAVDAVLVTANIVTGTEQLLLLGQAFVGVAWTAALLGLLGVYPRLADRSRWLSRAGAVFAVIGVIVFATMSVTVLVYYAGIPVGEYSDIGQFFIPGVLIGSVLAFITFSAASLRTDVHSGTFGILLLVPAVLVVANILRFVVGLESATITLGIVIGDAVVMLAIGYLLLNGGVRKEHALDGMKA